VTGARLPENDARSENERAGVTFPTPIINYPIDWAI
jgi:hypothetical protein